MLNKGNFVRFESLDGLVLVEKATADFSERHQQEISRFILPPVSAVFGPEPQSISNPVIQKRVYKFRETYIDGRGARIFVYREAYPRAIDTVEKESKKDADFKKAADPIVDSLLGLTKIMAEQHIGPVPEVYKKLMDFLNAASPLESVATKALVGLIMETCITAKSYDPLISAYPVIIETLQGTAKKD